MSEMVGGSLTGATSTLKVVELFVLPSLTVRVMSVLPNWFVAGTRVTVRVPVEPPNWKLAFGMRTGLDDEPEITSPVGGGSASLIVNEIGPIGVSSIVVRSATLEMVWGVLLQLG